eukprot:scaffold3110_cov114-Skeletonema_marinoi.AAC.6
MMEFNNWSMPHPSAASAAAAEAAAAAAANSVYAVVTPTGDEFEQLHSQQSANNSVSIESAVVAVSSAAPSAAATAGSAAFPCCGYYHPTPSSTSTFTPPPSGGSYGHPSYAPSAASLVPGYHPIADHKDEGSVMEAAQALCFLKTLGAGCPPQRSGTVVDVAMKMMSSEKNEHFHHDQEGALLRSLDVVEDAATSDNHVLSNSLVHPDRLAIDDDVDEVNKLHQYVRKELLEIFVVPQISDSDSEDDEDDDEAYRVTKKRKNNEPASLPTTRAAAARRESFASATTSIAAAASTTTATSSSTQRHYPGRVGFRCVHCADCRRKSASKAAFFPLRLTNIYREVCAWQRIHFKTCPMIPESVREKYDHYKMIDTSRGKVRYWESSAKKIGLQNNPDRYDGIIFANTAWRG